MKESLKGKVAIVTGASRGYGLGIAEELLSRGAKVWITARDKTALAEAAKKCGAKPIVADITISEDWDKVFETVMSEISKVDILVNNAGAGVKITEIPDQSDEDIKKCIDVNLTGTILGSKRATKIMREQKSGTIVNISSICSIQAWAGWGVYAAAKAGLEQFTRSLYVEMRAYGARATCITPSWGDTGFLGAANLPSYDKAIASKCIKPKELGKIVADVCALPEHLVIQEMVVLPLVQEIVPF